MKLFLRHARLYAVLLFVLVVVLSFTLYRYEIRLLTPAGATTVSSMEGQPNNQPTSGFVLPDGESTRTIEVDGRGIRVAVAATQDQQSQGLSGQAGLADGQGMLFVFQEDKRYAFWMKDMNFSLDILWINAQGNVVYIAQDVSPDTYPHDFVPPYPARYVLEVPAGYTARTGIHVGSLFENLN